MATNRLVRADTTRSSAETEPHSSRSEKLVRQGTDISPTSPRNPGRRTTVSHRKVVFSDPVAFRYLEEDESTIVIDRWKRLQGYELYVVEQWACSRTHPTFIICTYTGDASKSALVNVLAIPNDQSRWSKRLKIYFDAVSQFHAREQDTPLGTLMVTNLSGFPSALAVIPVPDGDIKKHREDFLVNENLKRMGCAGRAAVTLSDPPPTMITKFHHLYQTSESIHFKSAVTELVKICQIALVLYGKLDSIYTDGLLCDITERAISDWWNDIGTEFHNIEPSDGILGPTTVSAILGLLIGAYNRLKAAGVAIGKDVLDINAMKRTIGSFQKATKLERTRRLDRETLDRLHRVTAKNASGDGWTVPRAVKSTVAELSGKGGEMIMGVVGGRDKTGISEVETLDIDKLAHLVPGPKMKWLWQGKRLKAPSDGAIDDSGEWVFSTDNAGNFLWKSGSLHHSNADGHVATSNHHNDGKLGRIRDAVPGLRSHNLRSSRHGDNFMDTEEQPNDGAPKSSKELNRPTDHNKRMPTSADARRALESTLREKIPFNLALASEETLHTQVPPRISNRLQPVRTITDPDPRSYREQLRAIDRQAPDSPGKKKARAEMKNFREEVKADIYQNFATEFDEQGPESRVLKRTRSARLVRELDNRETRFLEIPRRLSYSFVEGTTIQPTEALDVDDVIDTTQQSSLTYQLAAREAEKHELKELAAKIVDLEQMLLPYTENEMLRVVELDMESREHLSELNNIYYARLEEYQSLQATSTELVARDKASLNDGVRKVEMLGNKLDYELNALQSRMQEVEDGATEFEKNVVEVEARVAKLIDEKQNQSSDPRSIPLLQRLFNFMGSKT